jgi:rubrerythrin
MAKMGFATDPYDFSKHKEQMLSKRGDRTDLEARYFAEKKMKDEMALKGDGPSERAERHCPLCGYALGETWKFCPECGVSLTKK